MSKFNDIVINQAFKKKYGEPPVETLDKWLAKDGNSITKIKSKGQQRFAAAPKPTGINPQDLLDAAAGTEDEPAVIAFLEGQGYDVTDA